MKLQFTEVGVLSLIIVIAVIFAIILLILLIKVINLNKQIRIILPKDKNVDVEQILLDYKKDVKAALDKEDEILENINTVKSELLNEISKSNDSILSTNKKLENAIQKFAIVRFNPFDDVGGDLSYAIAILDENNNGIIITSIYGRDACHTYAKEILNAICEKHKLSSEEKEALNNAMLK